MNQLVCAILLLLATSCRGNFILGDFVPTAHKSYFGGERSGWHDALGAHCPKFGLNNAVRMPLYKPPNRKGGDEYKIQLSFDGDRIVTPWLKVLGPRAPAAPVLVIELTRSGDALVAARGTVESLPPQSAEGERVKKEFEDETAWPKHLPIQYKWQSRHDVDIDQGVLVLFASGLFCLGVLAFGVFATYKKQLLQFMDDISDSNAISSRTFVKAE